VRKEEFFHHALSLLSPLAGFALCVFSPLLCAAQKAAASGAVSYLSFEVPGALGTYPMSINNSMTVAGYYYVSSTVTGGFLRDATGTITTFSIRGGLWTEPESINDAGDVTGFYEVVAGTPQRLCTLRGWPYP
jgi:hypothetical protein